MSETRPGRHVRLDDDVLKAAYRRAHATAAGPHVSEDEWERLTCGELGDAERDRLLAHIFSCLPCQQVHRSLLQVKAEAPSIDAGATPPAPARPVARTWMFLGGLATAAALVAAVLVDLEPLRGNRDATVTRSQAAHGTIAVVTPAKGASLERRRFAWQPVPDAETFEIVVSTADGGAVWRLRVSEAFADLPSEVALPVGLYYWQVSALRNDAVVASSPLLPFRVD